jgi:hypothetical protein
MERYGSDEGVDRTAQPVCLLRDRCAFAFVHCRERIVSATKPMSTVVLALRREDAARSLGISDETFDKHVRPSLPAVRIGGVTTYSVASLERWLGERAESPADELERRLR